MMDINLNDAIAACHVTIADLEAENARLRGSGASVSGLLIDAVETGGDAIAELERERDRYKALAERRGAILKVAYDLINYREHAFYEPEVPLETYLYQLHNWLDWALPAIAATPDGEKEGR